MKLQVKRVDWQTNRQLLSEIRVEVFVHEQGVPIEEEWDQWDETSRHWLIYSEVKSAATAASESRPIGTARLTPQGQIGRMAVLEQHRSNGVGFHLLEAVIKEAELHFEQIYLHAQTHAIGFYQRAEFKATGPQFDEAGIPHQKMVRNSSASA